MAIWERKLVGTATSGFLYSGPMLHPVTRRAESNALGLRNVFLIMVVTSY